MIGSFFQFFGRSLRIVIVQLINILSKVYKQYMNFKLINILVS